VSSSRADRSRDAVRTFVFEASGSHGNDYVFDGGGSLRIEDGDSRGHY
jgi:hypothetical protein